MNSKLVILVISIFATDLSAQDLSSPRQPLDDLQFPLLKYEAPRKTFRNFEHISPPKSQLSDESPESQYLRAYKIYEASEHLIEIGESPKAQSLLIDTLAALNRISINHPDFQPVVVQFRIKKTTELLSKVSE